MDSCRIGVHMFGRVYCVPLAPCWQVTLQHRATQHYTCEGTMSSSYWFILSSPILGVRLAMISSSILLGPMPISLSPLYSTPPYPAVLSLSVFS